MSRSNKNNANNTIGKEQSNLFQPVKADRLT